MRSLLLVCLLASVAAATTTTTTLVETQNAGILASAQAATGSGNTGIVCIALQGARQLQIDVYGITSPSASFIIEHSTDGGTTWSTLGNACFAAMTAIALSTGTPGVSVPIPNPLGCYRVNFTAYSAGAFTATYQAQL
jgi:hypothetical protein